LFNQKFDKETIFLNLEEPNFCFSDDGPVSKLNSGWGRDFIDGGVAYQAKYIPDKVLTICPYMVEWDDLNKREFVFLPYNNKFIKKEFKEKTYDVIYTGSIPKYTCIGDVIEYIKKYNYIDICYNRGNKANVSYVDKINYYSKTKIALVHGVVGIGNLNQYRSFPKYENLKAFNNLDSHLIPQFKYRVMESAFNKCIMLMLKDEWNVIENWFEPNVDFLYFETFDEFKNMVDEILNNYNKYKYIADNAYNKAINNYTTKHFVERYLT